LNIVVSKLLVVKNSITPATAIGKYRHKIPVFHAVYDMQRNKISIIHIVSNGISDPSKI